MKQELPENINELINKLTTITVDLQQEVAELKEDTIVNASHIAIVKNSHKENILNVNKSVTDLNTQTTELADSIEEEFSKTGFDNYSKFIKTLLEDDFKALQNEAIEQSKRELLNAKIKPTKSNENIFVSFLKTISPVLSLVSFILLMIICVKFKLFGALFQ